MLLFLLVQIFLVAPLVSGQYFPIAQQPLTNYEELDYYWRDYDGINIPKDAVPVPDNPDDNVVYIGQALNWPFGTSVVTIHPGVPNVTVFFDDEIQTVSKGIQILCSPHPETFYWQDGNVENFPIDMLSIYPIVGGVESEESVLYVGKALDGVPGAPGGKKPALVGKIRQHLVMSQDYDGMFEMQTRMSALVGSEIEYFDDFSILIYDDSQILSRDLWHESVDGGIAGFLEKLRKPKNLIVQG